MGDEKNLSEDEFREQQRQQAAAQGNTSSEAVPALPPAFDRSEEGDPTLEKLREVGHPLVAGEKAATKADYDRANSDKAKKDALKQSRRPRLAAAEPVRVMVPDGDDDPNRVFNGSYGAIINTTFKDSHAERVAAAGTPESRFAEVESYLVRLRDGRADVIEVKPEHLEQARNSDVVRSAGQTA